jgi:crotonobetainyl-CoA:carnitine CoA-transferase CaiB-like acyl-CoA transferase
MTKDKPMTGRQKDPEAQGPLKGLRVIDVGMVFAGPLVATNLGDLGADVIKVEHPKGDEVRNIGRFKNGEGLWWRVAARNKRVIAADIGAAEGAEIVRRLAKDADVLIENFRPGRFASWGLDYASLAKDNPGLVMMHISGYGQEGPYRNRPGMGTLAESFSGFAMVTGEADRPPTLPQFPFADGIAGMTGAYAVLAALWAREKNGGKGDEIDLNLYEPLLSMMGPMVIDYDQLGHIAKRRGNRSTWSVPRNSYRTKDDKWVAVSSAANSIAIRMFRAIGRDDMADDPELRTNPGRVARLEECDAAIAAWVLAHSQEEVLAQFGKYEVVAGPICDVEQLMNDPQVAFNHTIIEMPDEALGKVRLQNVIPRFRNQPAKMRWVGRHRVGIDTSDVLTELGYTADQIRALQAKGVVKCPSNEPEQEKSS